MTTKRQRRLVSEIMEPSPAVITLLLVFWLKIVSPSLSSIEADDVFSSVSKMEDLVHQEKKLVDTVDSFLIEAKQRLAIVEE